MVSSQAGEINGAVIYQCSLLPFWDDLSICLTKSLYFATIALPSLMLSFSFWNLWFGFAPQVICPKEFIGALGGIQGFRRTAIPNGGEEETRG